MDKKQKVQKTSTVFLLTIMSGALVVLNMLLLYFVSSETTTIHLMRQERISLDDDRQIIASAQDIYDTYGKEIKAISAVFPNEETVPFFIQALEQEIRLGSDTYTVKFSSLTPLVEGDKLYLLLVITMTTDVQRLEKFLNSVERLSYMTHVVSMGSKTPDGFTGTQEVSIGVKVYVQNPFTN